MARKTNASLQPVMFLNRYYPLCLKGAIDKMQVMFCFCFLQQIVFEQIYIVQLSSFSSVQGHKLSVQKVVLSQLIRLRSILLFCLLHKLFFVSIYFYFSVPGTCLHQAAILGSINEVNAKRLFFFFFKHYSRNSREHHWLYIKS